VAPSKEAFFSECDAPRSDVAGGDKLAPEHIAESLRLIDDHVGDGRPAFLEHRQVQDAVLRRLEILADATAQLTLSSRIATQISRGGRSTAFGTPLPTLTSTSTSNASGRS
jgi:hypothetical protein